MSDRHTGTVRISALSALDFTVLTVNGATTRSSSRRRTRPTRKIRRRV